MSNTESDLSRKVIELERELQYWQQCYYKLNDKYQNIKACHKCINEDDDEIEIPPAKRLKINSDELDVEKCDLNDDAIQKDPLKCLPEPVAIDIFDYLQGNELLTAMQVSKSWRDFIKVQSVLMRKINFVPTYEICELPLLNKIFNEENIRSYKHFVGPIYLRKSYFIEARPIEFLSSTLETLIIKPNYDYFDYDPYNINSSEKIGIERNFFNLTMLVYPINSSKVKFNLLKSSTFPVLTHLKLYSADKRNFIDFKELKAFLCLFPKLEVVTFDDDDSSCFKFCNDEITHELPKIKAFSMRNHKPKISDAFQASLEKLEHHSINLDQLKPILKSCKNLKSISILCDIWFYFDEVCEFERHESLEILMIGALYNEEEDDEEDFMNYSNGEKVQRNLKNLLAALPSLKELRLQHGIITDEILKFIASNMINLKTLHCGEISEELQRSYDEIRENPHLYVNTTFEFTDAIKWNQIKDDFPLAASVGAICPRSSSSSSY